MQPGTKPKASHLKLMEGVRPSRVNRDAPKPRPVRPVCPGWLMDEAKDEWRRVVPELDRVGVLTTVDMAALAGYCQAYARWQQSEQVIEKEGATYESETQTGGLMIRARPEVRIAQVYLAHMRSFCAEFGLTPSSRERLTVPDLTDDDEGSMID